MTTGLREAKRAALAHELAAIAFNQVRARGFASVTVDDIVSEANVSRRTFSNYYTCKEAAVAAVVGHQVTASLAAWNPPACDDVLTLVGDLVDHQVAQGALRALSEVAGLADAHPQLVPFVREAQWQVWAAVGNRVVGVLDRPSVHDVETVHLVVGALFGLVSTRLASRGSGAADVPGHLHEATQRALTRLRAGLSAPA